LDNQCIFLSVPLAEQGTMRSGGRESSRTEAYWLGRK